MGRDGMGWEERGNEERKEGRKRRRWDVKTL